MIDSQCWTLSCQDRGTSTSDLAKAAAVLVRRQEVHFYWLSKLLVAGVRAAIGHRDQGYVCVGIALSVTSD